MDNDLCVFVCVVTMVLCYWPKCVIPSDPYPITQGKRSSTIKWGGASTRRLASRFTSFHSPITPKIKRSCPAVIMWPSHLSRIRIFVTCGSRLVKWFNFGDRPRLEIPITFSIINWIHVIKIFTILLYLILHYVETFHKRQGFHTRYSNTYVNCTTQLGSSIFE